MRGLSCVWDLSWPYSPIARVHLVEPKGRTLGSLITAFTVIWSRLVGCVPRLGNDRAGSCPIPASSGQTERHRLSRHGDRQLNRALYAIALTRIRIHPETQAYAARRLAEGKTSKDIRRGTRSQRATGRTEFDSRSFLLNRGLHP